MAKELVRFGIAMEEDLLAAFDEVVRARGGSRSEALRDLARAEVARAQARKGGEAIGVLSLIYNHHVRELTEKLTEMQHELEGAVHSTLHIHLDHDNCLEVTVLRGRADKLQDAANRMTATRGVSHGELSLVASDLAHRHAHEHGHPHSHPASAPATKPPATRKAKGPKKGHS